MSTAIQNSGTLAFAYGRIATLKQILLTESDCNRLLGAKDYKDAVAIVTELPFTRNIDQGLKTASTILPAVEQWIIDECARMSPTSTQTVLSILWADSMAALLSIAIKEQKGLVIDEGYMQSTVSNLSPEWLTFIEHGDSSVLPKVAAEIFALLPSELLSAKQVDTACFKAAAQYKLRAAKRSASKAIVQYCKHTIDTRNILNALRFTKGFDTEYFLPGGTLTAKDVSGTQEQVRKTIAASYISYELSAALQAGRLENIEVLLSNVIKNDLANMWSTPLSIEPVFAFAATGFNHLEYTRNMLIGKQNQLDPQELKHVLPTFIPATAY